MKALVIAEKPSVAMALASVLGARTRKDGYVEGNGYIVSWCVGHLVGLCDASEYDEKYKKWRYEDLPIVPECWKHKILEGTKKQFGILKKLMRDSKVDEVICATDAGREGDRVRQPHEPGLQLHRRRQVRRAPGHAQVHPGHDRQGGARRG